MPPGSAQWLFARSERRLRAALFTPANVTRGSVVLSPGRTEPIEKYGEVASELLDRGFAVLLHDWAGQGLSARFQPDALRGDVEGGWQALLADYSDLLASYAERLPRPWVAMGHSMGGALTALALTQSEASFDRALLCAPMMQFRAGPLPFRCARLMVTLARACGRETQLVRRQLDPVDVPFEGNLLTHDSVRYERSIALYRAHPELKLGEPTWRWLQFGIDLKDQLERPGMAEDIGCPVTIVAAGDDRIVNNAAIARFSARVPGATFVELPGASHEILMETDEHRAKFWQLFDQLTGDMAVGQARPPPPRARP